MFIFKIVGEGDVYANVCRYGRQRTIWWSQFSLTFMWLPGIKSGLPCLCHKPLYSLTHLTAICLLLISKSEVEIGVRLKAIDQYKRVRTWQTRISSGYMRCSPRSQRGTSGDIERKIIRHPLELRGTLRKAGPRGRLTLRRAFLLELSPQVLCTSVSFRVPCREDPRSQKDFFQHWFILPVPPVKSRGSPTFHPQQHKANRMWWELEPSPTQPAFQRVLSHTLLSLHLTPTSIAGSAGLACVAFYLCIQKSVGCKLLT